MPRLPVRQTQEPTQRNETLAGVRAQYRAQGLRLAYDRADQTFEAHRGDQVLATFKTTSSARAWLRKQEPMPGAGTQVQGRPPRPL